MADHGRKKTEKERVTHLDHHLLAVLAGGLIIVLLLMAGQIWMVNRDVRMNGIEFHHREAMLGLREIHYLACRSFGNALEQYIETCRRELEVIYNLLPQGADSPAAMQRLLTRAVSFMPEINLLELRVPGRETLRAFERAYLDKAEADRVSALIPQEFSATADLVYGPVYTGSEPERIVMILGLPFAGEFEGKSLSSPVLWAEIDLLPMAQLVVDTRFSRNAALQIVDASGRIIFHPDFSIVLQRPDVSREPLTASFLKGIAGGLIEFQGPDQVDMLGTFLPLPDLGWGILSREKKADAFLSLSSFELLFAKEHRSLVILFILAALYSVLYTLVVWNLFRQRTVMPLHRLERAMVEVGSGDFDQYILVRGVDEAARAIRAFNRAMRRLKGMDEESGEEEEADGSQRS